MTTFGEGKLPQKFGGSCFDRFDLEVRVNVCDESPWWEVFDGSEDTVLDFLSVIQNTLSRADKGDEGVVEHRSNETFKKN